MGERKVLNKYYPPDFDPSKIPRIRRPKDQQIKSRVMIPFTAQCTNCGDFMYRGKKFNAKKEDTGREYLNITIWRFHLRCPSCAQAVTFLTDPENNGYIAERGAERTFEPWTEKQTEKEEFDKKVVEEEEGDAMKALENRTMASKREMDQQDQLEQLKELVQRNSVVNTDEILSQLQAKEAEKREEEALNALTEKTKNFVRRLPDLDEEEEMKKKRERNGVEAGLGFFSGFGSGDADKAKETAKEPSSVLASLGVRVVAKKKKKGKKKADKGEKKEKEKVEEKEKEKKRESETVLKDTRPVKKTAVVGLGALAGYGSDSDSD